MHLRTCLMLRKNIVFGRCQRSLNMCTPAVHGIRVVFDTFSCSRTCTCLAHGCACVSADVTRLDLAHMFDATQEHRLREMSTFQWQQRFGSCTWQSHLMSRKTQMEKRPRRTCNPRVILLKRTQNPSRIFGLFFSFPRNPPC